MPFDSGLPSRRTARAVSAGGEAWLCCRACGLALVRPDWLVPIRGDHEHTVLNPVGLVFRIWCFSQAVGLRVSDPASTAFTWFPGYAWRVAHCQGCGGHLGWCYDGSATPPRFHALIGDRLRLLRNGTGRG